MAFTPVSTSTDSKGHNFRTDARTFYNACGAGHYMGLIEFEDVRHATRQVPVFHQECLEDDKPNTLKLVTTVRQAMRGSYGKVPYLTVADTVRSIHQNSSGNLPYKRPDRPTKAKPYEDAEGAVASVELDHIARVYGELPNNQESKETKTLGEFLEFTCQDDMSEYGRLVVDYRFGIIYMTYGHYHPDSFALLVRSKVELDFEIKPVLGVIGATFKA